MKRQLYDLTDEPFLMFANRIGKVLKEEGIHHNIVGGTAVQGYLLDMLCKKYNVNVISLLNNSEVRVQDYVRSTDDIDLALKLEERDDTEKIKRINSILPKFAFEEVDPNGQFIVEIRSARVGASRPTFRVYVDGKGGDEEVLAINISRGQPKDLKRLDDCEYNEFLNQSKQLNIPYNQTYDLTINVPRLEHLLAAKIAGGRAKDLMDNKNLADLARILGRDLNFSEMKRVLLPVHQDKYMTFLRQQYPAEYDKY